jgi:hypothetical protein
MELESSLLRSQKTAIGLILNLNVVQLFLLSFVVFEYMFPLTSVL